MTDLSILVTDLSILVTDLSISTLGVHVWRAFPGRNRIITEYISEFLTELLSDGPAEIQIFEKRKIGGLTPKPPLSILLNLTTEIEMRIYQSCIIERVYRGGIFHCHLQDNAHHKINAYPCGNMRKNRITLCAGDLVTVEISPYDLHRGRVVWRNEL